MNKGRFIVIVLDSFGIGAMADVPEVRPADIGSNTCLHLLEYPAAKQWPTLIDLGLINALNKDVPGFPKSKNAIFGKSNLKHFGADSYFGHQEIAGTDPKKPLFTQIQRHLDDIEADLLSQGFTVERVSRGGLSLLKVNDVICIGDNMETDLGQAINVVGALDYCGFDLIDQVGQIVRKHVHVPRVIAFGGSGVTIERILDNIVVSGDFIGIDAPGSGVYDQNYHVIHIGYGVDTSKQVPIALANIGVENHFYGKVENIIYNPKGTSFACVDTEDTFDALLQDMKDYTTGFFFLNIQETDLAGHAEDAERYIDRLNVSDRKLAQLINCLNPQDFLVVMADHGNDPTIGHTRHTRERVPLLIKQTQHKGLIDIGERDTMADVGQTVADYFGTKIEHGTSFLDKIMK
ncbi:phosphopentomutase [Erysipelothrix sp. HDW6C]|uniref:phosphopentomutase n=1 Tax=Erysipelothrix sp. HDW6C TaxID=2714930 RepID=UPI00196AAA08|nr:phosphopentomutase [Erysipelothrix sp. HDW6C]